MTPLLDVQDLVIEFGPLRVVHGASFQVAPGETLALIGESGCGKSTTALAVMRLLPSVGLIAGGRVVFEGVDLATASSRALRDVRGKRMSLILQEPMTSLNPVLTVGAQIAEVLRRHERLSRRAIDAKVVELLDLVGIPDARRRAREFPHSFSGGMRQRVMIAMAVACQPRLLIADEPTTALDVTIQAQVLDLLDDLRRQLGMAVLLITHDLGVVAQWADRVAVMYAGRVVEQARVGDFFAEPRHPYAQGLLEAAVGEGQAHYTTTRLREIAGSVASAAGESGCSFAPRCPKRIPNCRLQPPQMVPSGAHRQVACILETAHAEVDHAAAIG